ncbi:MAG: DUF3307 domain-containing protein [Devosiaceae bacterium]
MLFDPIVLLTILLGLQAKHFLFDFVFQSDWQVRNKGHYGHPGGLVHAGMHALGTLTVMLIAMSMGKVEPALALGIATADFAIHYHVDWTKAQLSRRLNLTPERHGFWIALGADQAAHQATYIGLVAVLLVPS